MSSFRAIGGQEFSWRGACSVFQVGRIGSAVWPLSGHKEKDMFRILRMTALALIAICGLGGSSRAQAPQDKPQGQFQGKVNVNEVLLDVLVTDAKGNVIVGLDKSDFVVKENGKPVDLTGVTFYSNRRFLQTADVLKKKGIDIDRVPENRYFIVFFEDQKGANA